MLDFTRVLHVEEQGYLQFIFNCILSLQKKVPGKRTDQKPPMLSFCNGRKARPLEDRIRSIAPYVDLRDGGSAGTGDL